MTIPLGYSNVVGCGYWQTRTVLAEQVVEKRELVDDENDFPADAVTDASLCVAVTASSGQLKACYLI